MSPDPFDCSGDPKYRRQAALAMGRIGDRSFAPTLIRLLDDRTPIQQAAVTSLAQVTGQGIGRGDDPRPPILAEQVARWKRWSDRR
jgi:HEAT repeat protein